MVNELPDALKNLPAADRLALIGLLWDSLGDDEVKITDAQVAELHRRADALAENRDTLATWAEVRGEIEQRLR